MRRLKVLLENIYTCPNRLLSHISFFAVLQEDEIDKTAAICSGVKFYRGRLGRYSYIGNNSFVIDTSIGNFTSIAPDCYIGGTRHPLDWVSTSPLFHKHENIMRKNFAYHNFKIFDKTNIGNDVWIGDKVMVKAGLKIADGAVIGMGSIVTKNVGPYEVWAGNPAKMIRKRFDENTIGKLMKIQWWNWPDQKISELASYMTDVQEFLKKVGECDNG